MALSKKNILFLAAAITAAALFAALRWHRATSPVWTMAFYLDGSTGLLMEQQKNLREIIRGAGRLKNTAVVVYFDRGPSPKAPILYAWNGPRIFHVKGSYSDILSNPVKPGLPVSVEARRFNGAALKGMPENDAKLFREYYSLSEGRYAVNRAALKPEHEKSMTEALHKTGYLTDPDREQPRSDSDASMARFFSFVRDNFPARHYAFFITGHGQGWFSGTVRHVAEGKTVESADSPAFTAGSIARGLAFSGPDVLCLDLCLMADLESVCELRRSASYLILGQGPMPAGAQDYEGFMRAISDDSPAGPEEMARAVFFSSARSLEKSRLGGALSLIKTGRELDAFYKSFSAAVSGPGMQRHIQKNEGMLTRLPEWGALAGDMINVDSIVAVINSHVPEKIPEPGTFVLGSLVTGTRATGLSIYYPADCKMFKKLRDEYAALNFNRVTEGRWPELIDARCGQIITEP